MNLKTRLAASRGVCTALHLRRREPECRAMPPQASPSKRGRSPAVFVREAARRGFRAFRLARGPRSADDLAFCSVREAKSPPPEEKARRTGVVNSAREVPRSAIGQNFINDRASSPARGARSPAAGAKSPAAGAESPVGRVPWSSDAERGPRCGGGCDPFGTSRRRNTALCVRAWWRVQTQPVRRRWWADPDPLGRGASAGKWPRVPSKGTLTQVFPGLQAATASGQDRSVVISICSPDSGC